MGAAAGLCLVLLLILRLWFLEPVVVTATSMAPTIPPGSIVWINKVSPVGRAGARIGEVVTLRSPDDGALIVKRVVAVEGQNISMQDGVLNVDGIPTREPFVDQKTIDGMYFGEVRVGQNEIFVLGDNREASIDSRHFGPVSTDAVTGRVIGVP
ncbi:signal peptidase I [Paenarthrobacter sp. MSM-2-10-13]|nr:signal peptidase I [Paenarthrobacter sp. MSM-2-10-13]NKR13822.1 hypothetical protein [Arthrobacter sp. M5]NKR18571.1 hypothetical protein [Arthrobacter sp. M6]QMU84446.1 signal peptidase I [Paenarthrobacter ureafaciens]